MAELTPQEMAGKLTTTGFSRSGQDAQAPSEPVVDTPMVVTIDELRPYELDPRLTRNPLYDEIKASIRERGLDAPPPITKRPGADHFIIRNGGNTRLSILRDLWSETKDIRFFRIVCLFRPWPKRGEIIALTGHLAENELHGGLTFIERTLGVEKARELYEQEIGKPLSQTELARRLTADGYPIQQSHISRMQDTVRYLLPAIPNVLYAGLGRHQVERLAVLRKSSQLVWEQHAGTKQTATDFEMLFHDVLAQFDRQPADFSLQRAQDELIGHMSDLLGVDYNALELDIDNVEHRQRVVQAPPSPTQPAPTADPLPGPSSAQHAPSPPVADHPQKTEDVPEAPALQTVPAPAPPDDPIEERLQGHIVSPAPSTERLQAIRQLVAEHTGETLPDFADNVLHAIPVQVGGLYPISDVWYIDTGLDTPDRLRIHIAQFAREIAEEAGLAERIEPTEAGIGFTSFVQDIQALSAFSRAVLTLLRALSRGGVTTATAAGIERGWLEDDLAPLLLGTSKQDNGAVARLSDSALVKLFRLVRLARRISELESGIDQAPDP
ncbi:ParB family protein [Phytopseudomonas dryadis]|uniref:ParB/Sulfiredoxin domain-containing protein n=1 Tax=Phytopseudomonas dryadis TaxID=2487520 RepID=A0A4Q9QWB0_9GAMM|nr:ParB family protein [Pseudomonas dryadis]TBU88464.1 hypothetical protein DNK44_18370 [Pseudomonas dryadis]